MPLDVPRMQDASIDGGVLLFVLAVSLVTGVVFGVVPAWRMSRSMPAQALRDGSRTVVGSSGRNRVHNGLVIAQTAVGLVLLVSSGLLIRSFIRILNVDPGFDPRHVLSARAGVSFNTVSHDQHLQFFQRALARISALPGVQSASAGWPLPMSGIHATISFNIQGRPIAKGDEPSEGLALAMPGYFETMRISFRAALLGNETESRTRQPSSSTRRSPKSISAGRIRLDGASRCGSGMTYSNRRSAKSWAWWETASL
jgi:putative ABC transport system permease protein